MATRSNAAAFALLLCVASIPPARAEPPQPVVDLSLPDEGSVLGPNRPGEAEIDLRLDAVERSLEANEGSAELWQWGWTSFFAATLAYGTYDAIDTDDHDDRVVDIVNAVQSAGGLAQMLIDPLPARLGTEPLRALPTGSREAKLARLSRGEALMRENADRANEAYDWLPHVANLAVNLGGGGVIWAFADLDHAALSAIPGILIGELQLWTIPQGPAGDWDSYRSRIGEGAGMVSWSIEPRMGGAAIHVRF